MAEVILIVDDEDSVRRTFQEWLEQAHLDCRILAAADAESALTLANQSGIDLAILDWNLGAGNHGLQLLEDLYLFQPDVVAIMVTGYAHQATPLDAMRMGVRDYLDKNQELDRERFVQVVRRQLERIRPAKRTREIHNSLAAFREAVGKLLPLVESTAVLSDPVPLSIGVRSLLRFLTRTTQASDGVLIVRTYDAQREPAEVVRGYSLTGEAIALDSVPFQQTVAAMAISMQQPCALCPLEMQGRESGTTLRSFETGRASLLAMPMDVAPGVQAVLELFDKSDADGKPQRFHAEDHLFVAAAADFGTELLRHALAERQSHRLLFDALSAALGAGETLAESMAGGSSQEPPPRQLMERIRESLKTETDSEETLHLAEAIRELSMRHGPEALRHCLRIVGSVRELLDRLTS